MITSETHRNILNFVLFQAGWLFCVLYPGHIAVALVVAILVAHFVLVSGKRFAELQFIGVGVVLGTLLDTLWFRTGILGLENVDEILAAPPWLVAIWAIFMTTLCHSLYWVGQKRWLPFVLAPVAGPFAYWSASKLGVVTMPDPAMAIMALAVGWLALFPLLLFIRRALYTELEA